MKREQSQEGLQPYQTRISTSEVRAGDFLDLVEPEKLRGPRGGRYRWDGLTVESRVTKACWVYIDLAGQEQEVEASEGWIPGRLRGFRIVTRTGGRSLLPGNLAELTTAIVRRPEGGPSC